MLMGAAVLSASAQTDFRHISFDEALTAAKQENKLIFIDFYTTWCGPCKMMSNKVFPQKNVGDFMNAKFIPLKMDAEKEGLELAKKYAVKAYPTYIILNAQGKEEARFTGAMEGDVFINKVNASLDPEQKPERLKARYEAGDRTPELVNTYAMQHFEKRDEKGGFKVIDDYYNSLSDADRIKDENIFIFTRYTFDFDSERTRFMVDHIKDFSKASASSFAFSNKSKKLLRLVFSQNGDFHLQLYILAYFFAFSKSSVRKYAERRKFFVNGKVIFSSVAIAVFFFPFLSSRSRCIYFMSRMAVLAS